jgi:putative tryptophan/tyrosine transport system substrate-binding protein
MLRALILTLLFFCWPPVQAAQFAVLLSGDDPAFRDFLVNLKSTLPTSHWQLAWEGNVERFEQSPPAKVDLIVTIGANATRLILSRPESPPVIASLITRAAFDNIRLQNPAHRGNSTVLYLEQPMARQLAFINKLLPPSTLENRHIFTAVSDPKSEQLATLKQLAPGAGFKLSSTVVGSRESTVADIEQLIGNKYGLFLALPDSIIFSRDNVRPFLLTTYRHKIPVIAFSPPFVMAGALAALHTTPAQFALEIGQWVSKLPSPSSNFTLPPPKGPEQFSVSINRQVAQSFKLTLPTESEIAASLHVTTVGKP